MITYDDVNLNDLRNYWGSSLLLWQRDGEYIPVAMTLRDHEEYPIALVTYDEGEKVVNLTPDTFMKRCVIHFPILGYADLDGVPVLISPRGGQNRVKGIDASNLRFYTPVNAEYALFEAMDDMSTEARAALEAGEQPAKALVSRHRAYRTVVQRPQRSRTASERGYQIPPPPRRVVAGMVAQCANRRYMKLPQALTYLRTTCAVGVALSTYTCLVRQGQTLYVYDRASRIGEMVNDTTMRLTDDRMNRMIDGLRRIIPIPNILPKED